MPKKITNFLNLAQNYRVLLFDVVGVVHNGIDAYPHAIESINVLTDIPDGFQDLGLKMKNECPEYTKEYMRTRDTEIFKNQILKGEGYKKVIFLSNTPRPGTQTREKLQNLGLTKAFDVLTSGDVTRTLLTTKYAGQKVYHWGAERNQDIEEGLHLSLVTTIEQADVVLLTAFVEPDEDESSHSEIIEKIIHHNLPVLCANPDKVAMFGNKIRKCAGSIADKIIKQGGNVTLIGKPSPFIYHQILEDLKDIKPGEILMIGDTIETDIIGAKQVGIHSLLVLTGNTGNELRAHRETLDNYLDRKNWHQHAPTFYCDDLNSILTD